MIICIKKEDKFLGITPITDVYALYRQSDGSIMQSPLVAMLSVRTPDGDILMHGVDCSDTFNICEEMSNFEGYAHKEVVTSTIAAMMGIDTKRHQQD